MDNEKYLADMNPVEAMEFINDRIKRSLNNEEFLIINEFLITTLINYKEETCLVSLDLRLADLLA